MSALAMDATETRLSTNGVVIANIGNDSLPGRKIAPPSYAT
jgi:hypothetical protein